MFSFYIDDSTFMLGSSFKAKFKILGPRGVVLLQPPDHPSSLLTAPFILEGGALCHMVHVDTLTLHIQALFPFHYLPNSCSWPPTG